MQVIGSIFEKIAEIRPEMVFQVMENFRKKLGNCIENRSFI